MSVAAIPVRKSISVRSFAWSVGILVLIDIVALEIALLAGCLTRWALDAWFPIDLGPAQYRGLALGVLSIPLMYWLMGLYPGLGTNAVERLRKRTYATCITFCMLIAWDYLVQDRQWSRGALLASAMFALVLPPILDELTRYFLVHRGLVGVPVLVMGGGATGQAIIRQMHNFPTMGFHPIAILDDDPDKWGTSIEGVDIVGPLSMAKQFEERIQTIILAIPSLRRHQTAELLNVLQFPQVILIPNLLGIQTLWVTARDFGGVLGLEVRKNLLLTSNHILKRAIDLIIAVPSLIIAFPVLFLMGALIKLVDAGPIFFYQRREGQNGQTLSMLKLRTMYCNAEELLQDYLDQNPDEASNWKRFFKLKNDPRILPGVGHFLRRFSLDELPQLWHVLKGDMSLVGPRPFPTYHLDEFSEEFRRLRHSVAPGLTGLWQVSARSDGDINVQESLDTYYIRNWSPWLDIHILIRTVRVVLLGKGAY